MSNFIKRLKSYYNSSSEDNLSDYDNSSEYDSNMDDEFDDNSIDDENERKYTPLWAYKYKNNDIDVRRYPKGSVGYYKYKDKNNNLYNTPYYIHDKDNRDFKEMKRKVVENSGEDYIDYDDYNERDIYYNDIQYSRDQPEYNSVSEDEYERSYSSGGTDYSDEDYEIEDVD